MSLAPTNQLTLARVVFQSHGLIGCLAYRHDLPLPSGLTRQTVSDALLSGRRYSASGRSGMRVTSTAPAAVKRTTLTVFARSGEPE